MSKQVKQLIFIWLVAGVVAVGAFLYINHAVNALVMDVSGRETNYPADKPTLHVVDHTRSNIQPVLQSDGGDTDIQPALGAKALTWHYTGVVGASSDTSLDINKAIQSGGLVWVR
jgi:hypothetical protein